MATVSDLDRLIARPGLSPRTRLLAFGIAAVWRADWVAFAGAAARARALGVERAALEEMLLQAVLFCGFPRVVTAFEELERAWPATLPPSGGELPRDRQESAGRELFAAIYGANAERVENLLRGFHTDFHRFVFDVAYGRVLSRPGLPALERELLAIAALCASHQRRQFAGHARGARNLGASPDELHEILVTVCADGDEVETWRHRIPRT